jgi:hypothetical protein
MKKSYLSIFLLLFFIAAHAQLRIGIQAGAHSASVQQNMATVSNKALVGFSAGVDTRIGLGKRFSLHPGLNYVVKGYQYKEAKNDIGETYKNRW